MLNKAGLSFQRAFLKHTWESKNIWIIRVPYLKMMAQLLEATKWYSDVETLVCEEVQERGLKIVDLVTWLLTWRVQVNLSQAFTPASESWLPVQNKNSLSEYSAARGAHSELITGHSKSISLATQSLMRLDWQPQLQRQSRPGHQVCVNWEEGKGMYLYWRGEMRSKIQRGTRLWSLGDPLFSQTWWGFRGVVWKPNCHRPICTWNHFMELSGVYKNHRKDSTYRKPYGAFKNLIHEVFTSVPKWVSC